MDLLDVQQMLGHASILTTAKYTRLTQPTHRRAVEQINRMMTATAKKAGVVT